MEQEEAKKREREAGVEAINSSFSLLVAAVQNDVASVSNKCLSHHLITLSVQDEVLSSRSPEEKSTKLLKAIITCMKVQDDCFSKFLEILSELVDCDELLIRRIRKSCREAVERKVIASESTPKIRKIIIKRHMADMKSHVQGITARLASQCKDEKLISVRVYQQVVQSRKTKEAVTRQLLVNVCNSVRADGRKFEVFMRILEQHRSCRELAIKIQRDIDEELRGELVLPRHTSSPPEPAVISTLTEESDAPVPEVVGGQDNSKVLVASRTYSARRLRHREPNRRTDREFQLRMEGQQTQAKLHDYSKKEKENLKLKNALTDLEQMIQEKNQEIERLRVQREEFKFAYENCKVQKSRAEKKLNELQVENKHLKEKIVEHDRKIKTLEGEVQKLKEERKDMILEHGRKIRTLEGEVQKLKDERRKEADTRELQQLKEENEKKTRDYNTLNKEMADLKRQMSEESDNNMKKQVKEVENQLVQQKQLLFLVLAVIFMCIIGGAFLYVKHV